MTATVRAERVAEIGRQVAAGRYRIDGREVAEAMLDRQVHLIRPGALPAVPRGRRRR